MAYLVARLFGSYYLSKQRHDSKVLHYYRRPTWRSLLLFLTFVVLSHVIAKKAPHPYLSAACYILAAYFSYLVTEKYEEVIFDKEKRKVSMMSSRFFEKHLLGYRRINVVELEEVMGVKVEKQKIMGSRGFMVSLVLDGITISLTAQCTFGERSEHDSIVKEIRQFLDLPTAAEQDKATTRVLTQTGGRNIKKRRNN
ncbi:Cytochrome b-245 chaperone 1 homolog [Geodia barretti]|uniref:Essential for reactive oxygen species protein n=1 Tax=Geodia barretti TaxID=519541 RepID=A0AA35TCT2_GEOBA|nr:Cytochrome b-245 chaperone 1 homolog [Geodia barretti]